MMDGAINTEPPIGVPREHLPNRCRLVRRRFQHDGRTFDLEIGYSPGGKALEISCSGLTGGSHLAVLLDRFAQIVSVALQYGVPPEALVQASNEAKDAPADASLDIFGLLLDALMHHARLPSLL
jgi:hypothetical protein